ncbi:MFS transporter [Peterkaempfera griseoplana]|uniref:MFS transporter n=1 Tax=Peterkaempfera griseoplana TaxID=66896 RepID=UPI003899C074
MVGALVPESSHTEAGAWVSTAYNLGAALGTACGGVLADRSGPPSAFGVAAGLLAAVTALGALRALSRRNPTTALKAPSGDGVTR